MGVADNFEHTFTLVTAQLLQSTTNLLSSLDLAEQSVEYLNGANLVHLPEIVAVHQARVIGEWLASQAGKFRKKGLDDPTNSRPAARIWALLADILSCKFTSKHLLLPSYLIQGILLDCSDACQKPTESSSVELAVSLLKALHVLHTKFEHSWRPSLEQSCSALHAILQVVTALHAHDADSVGVLQAFKAWSETATVATAFFHSTCAMHPSPRKVFTAITGRVLPQLLQCSFPPAHVPACCSELSAACASVLQLATLNPAEIKGVAASLDQASAALLSSITTATSSAAQKLAADSMLGVAEVPSGKPAEQEANKAATRSYHHGFLQAVATLLAAVAEGSPDAGAALRALPALLEWFVTAWRRHLKSAEDDGLKPLKSKHAVDGDKVDGGAVTTAVPEFSMFAWLLGQVLEQMTKACKGGTKVAPEKPKKRRKLSQCDGRPRTSGARQFTRTGQAAGGETWAHLAHAAAALVVAAKDTQAYKPSKDVSGVHRAFLTYFASQVLEQCHSLWACHAAAVGGAFLAAELLDLEIRCVSSETGQLWQLCWQAAAAPSQSSNPGISLSPSWGSLQLACRLITAAVEVRQLQAALDTLIQQMRNHSMPHAAFVVCHLQFVDTLLKGVAQVPPGQRAGLAGWVAQQVKWCSSAIDLELQLALPVGEMCACVLQGLEPDMSTAASVHSAAAQVLQAVSEPLAQLLGASMALETPVQPALLQLWLRIFQAAVRLSSLCACLLPSLAPLPGQAVKAAGNNPVSATALQPLAEGYFQAIAPQGDLESPSSCLGSNVLADIAQLVLQHTVTAMKEQRRSGGSQPGIPVDSLSPADGVSPQTAKRDAKRDSKQDGQEHGQRDRKQERKQDNQHKVGHAGLLDDAATPGVQFTAGQGPAPPMVGFGLQTNGAGSAQQDVVADQAVALQLELQARAHSSLVLAVVISMLQRLYVLRERQVRLTCICPLIMLGRGSGNKDGEQPAGILGKYDGAHDGARDTACDGARGGAVTDGDGEADTDGAMELDAADNDGPEDINFNDSIPAGDKAGDDNGGDSRPGEEDVQVDAAHIGQSPNELDELFRRELLADWEQESSLLVRILMELFCTLSTDRHAPKPKLQTWPNCTWWKLLDGVPCWHAVLSSTGLRQLVVAVWLMLSESTSLWWCYCPSQYAPLWAQSWLDEWQAPAAHSAGQHHGAHGACPEYLGHSSGPSHALMTRGPADKYMKQRQAVHSQLHGFSPLLQHSVRNLHSSYHSNSTFGNANSGFSSINSTLGCISSTSGNACTPPCPGRCWCADSSAIEQVRCVLHGLKQQRHTWLSVPGMAATFAAALPEAVCSALLQYLQLWLTRRHMTGVSSGGDTTGWHVPEPIPAWGKAAKKLAAKASKAAAGDVLVGPLVALVSAVAVEPGALSLDTLQAWASEQQSTFQIALEGLESGREDCGDESTARGGENTASGGGNTARGGDNGEGAHHGKDGNKGGGSKASRGNREVDVELSASNEACVGVAQHLQQVLRLQRVGVILSKLNEEQLQELVVGAWVGATAAGSCFCVGSIKGGVAAVCGAWRACCQEALDLGAEAMQWMQARMQTTSSAAFLTRSWSMQSAMRPILNLMLARQLADGGASMAATTSLVDAWARLARCTGLGSTPAGAGMKMKKPPEGTQDADAKVLDLLTIITGKNNPGKQSSHRAHPLKLAAVAVTWLQASEVCAKALSDNSDTPGHQELLLSGVQETSGVELSRVLQATEAVAQAGPMNLWQLCGVHATCWHLAAWAAQLSRHVQAGGLAGIPSSSILAASELRKVLHRLPYTANLLCSRAASPSLHTVAAGPEDADAGFSSSLHLLSALAALAGLSGCSDTLPTFFSLSTSLLCHMHQALLTNAAVARDGVSALLGVPTAHRPSFHSTYTMAMDAVRTADPDPVLAPPMLMCSAVAAAARAVMQQCSSNTLQGNATGNARSKGGNEEAPGPNSTSHTFGVQQPHRQKPGSQRSGCLKASQEPDGAHGRYHSPELRPEAELSAEAESSDVEVDEGSHEKLQSGASMSGNVIASDDATAVLEWVVQLLSSSSELGLLHSALICCFMALEAEGGSPLQRAVSRGSSMLCAVLCSVLLSCASTPKHANTRSVSQLMHANTGSLHPGDGDCAMAAEPDMACIEAAAAADATAAVAASGMLGQAEAAGVVLVACGTFRCLESMLGRPARFKLGPSVVLQVLSTVPGVFVRGSRAGPSANQHTRWQNDVVRGSLAMVASCQMLVALCRHHPEALARGMAGMLDAQRALMTQLAAWAASPQTLVSYSRLIDKCADALSRVWEVISEHKSSLGKYCLHLVLDYLMLLTLGDSAPAPIPPRQQLLWQPGLAALAPACPAQALRRGAYSLMSCVSSHDLQYLHALGAQGGFGPTYRQALAELKRNYDHHFRYEGKV